MVSALVAVVVALIVVLILLAVWAVAVHHEKFDVGPGLPLAPPTTEPSADGMFGFDGAHRQDRSVYKALSRLYSTADVEPLITGQQYAYADYVRNVYGERTSYGDERGLVEYSSSGQPGDVGVDVGPMGIYEYGGRVGNYDDGMPATWNLPETPLRWYAPKMRDHYGVEGATPYTEGLYNLSEPDHDPLM